MKSKLSGLLIVIILIIVVSGFPVLGNKLEFVKNPKITHSEAGVATAKLKLIHTIESDFNEELFLVKPIALAVDDEKSLFVYDGMLKKIFKFDGSFKYVTNFLREGRGPGETYPMDIGLSKLYFAPDKKLYVADTYNNKVITFSKSGEHLEDIRLDENNRRPFYPVRDKKGNMYALSRMGEKLVDMLDSRMKKVHSFVDRSQNGRFLVYETKFDKREPYWSRVGPDYATVFYDLTANDDLVVYLLWSSRLFVFRGKRMERQYDLIPEIPLDILKDEAKRYKELTKKGKIPGTSFLFLFDRFVMDQDDRRYFYLAGHLKDRRILLYKFNLKGKLIKIIKGALAENCGIALKKNGLFYGFRATKGEVLVFKEEEDKK